MSHLFNKRWVNAGYTDVHYSFVNGNQWIDKVVEEPTIQCVYKFSLLNLIHDVKKLI